MSEITLQQVKCPSCGNVITSFNPFRAEVECPFCHTKSINPMVTAKNVPQPERVIVFNTNEKEFEQKLVDVLIKRDYIPTDIFEKIDSENVIKAYLPMYLYEGTFEASYTCQIGREETRYRRNSKGQDERYTVTVFEPASGQSQGNFQVLGLAYDGDDIPDELLQFSRRFSYRASDSREYDPRLLGLDGGDDAPITLPLNQDKEVVWDEDGRTQVKELAEAASRSQLSGCKYKNLRTTHSYELTTNGRYVMVPFWFVYYKYGEGQYYFVMDGQGKNTDCTVPQDANEKQLVNGMWKNFRRAFWLLIVVGLLYFVGEWAAVGIGALVWGALQVVLYLKASKEEKAQLDASKQRRMAGARRLGLVDVPTPPGVDTPNLAAQPGRPIDTPQMPPRTPVAGSRPKSPGAISI